MATTITTYTKLSEYTQMFANGNTELLVIQSSGGAGKTELVNKIMINTNKPYLLINCHLTPLELYKLAFIYRDMPIVLYDIESLLQSKQNIALIKQLAETSKDGIKRVGWHSTTERLEDIPHSFETKSRILVLANELPFVNKKLGQAVLTRGFNVRFEPSNEELINKIKEFCNDSEIIEFLVQHCRYANNFNLRSAVKAVQLKKEFPSCWKEELLKDMELNEEFMKVALLIQNYSSDAERIANYDKSERTFYRYKAKLTT